MMISWTNAYLKNLWAQIWVKWAKIGPKIKGFFDIFLKFGSLVFLEIAYDDSLEPCLTTRRTKTHEKKIVGPKLCPKLGFLPFSQGFIISFS